MRVLHIGTGIGQISRMRAANLEMLRCTARWSPQMTTHGASLMRALPRPAALLGILLILSNCAQPSQSAPEAEKPAQPQAARASRTDVACLAEAVYFEARGTSATGQQAVAHVVVNRTKDAEFPGTVCGVVSGVMPGW